MTCDLVYSDIKVSFYVSRCTTVIKTASNRGKLHHINPKSSKNQVPGIPRVIVFQNYFPTIQPIYQHSFSLLQQRLLHLLFKVLFCGNKKQAFLSRTEKPSFQIHPCFRVHFRFSLKVCVLLLSTKGFLLAMIATGLHP